MFALVCILIFIVSVIFVAWAVLSILVTPIFIATDVVKNAKKDGGK
jgi:hypothetical protein